MSAPTIATCRSVLRDGSLLTVTATRRERAGRADVKCSAPGDARLAERMLEVVRLARHTEPRFDSRDQVVISLDRSPAPDERDWELAVVLADRMVRGLWRARGEPVANGFSDAWQLGRLSGHLIGHLSGHIDGHPSGSAGADVLLGGADGLAHLGQLSGHGDPCAGVSSARAWFPLHSGGAHDSLCWVEVSVHPLTLEAGAAALDEEATIAVPGQDAARQLAVRQVLGGARHFDARAPGRWRTTVRFGAPHFQGRSYELALVMADRMARGRDFLPRARLIATGCSDAWHAGRVDTVEAVGPKCALLLREAEPGDRVLVPRAWQGALPAGMAKELRARGASLACVERIGLI
ncbi:hypothetical protein [Massilia sp. 9096]|uniref:hypothetical protein n=1 Tax=Massilia sp. 9096 TaxID=1500894 RepID=UPI000563EB85|nr:hypothetical protein [Massilia sp. 9096]